MTETLETNATDELVDLMPNRFVPGEVELDEARSRLVERRNAVLGASYRLHYQDPVHFVRGEGMYLYDPSGAEYLDFYNNVPSIGHCHPEVVAATAQQAAKLNVNSRYLDDVLVDYAETLVDTFPSEMDRVVFTCTGSESNDLALRIARYCTGAEGVIVSQYAYHGTSAAAAAISPNLGARVKLSPNVRTVRLPGVEGIPADQAAAFFDAEVKTAIADLNRRGIGVAAFIACGNFSSDGVHVGPAGFTRPAIESVRKAGGLFISDEVQSGFARMGDAFWGFGLHGVVPDLASLGKPMANGYPVGAVVGRHAYVDEFGQAARYSNTFAGNTVGIATAQAVLHVILRDNLQDHVKTVGAYLGQRFEDLAEHTDLIREVRGNGLFWGVSLGRAQDDKAARAKVAKHVVNGLRERRVLVSLTGQNEDVLKVRPPIICEERHVDAFADALKATLAECTS